MNQLTKKLYNHNIITEDAMFALDKLFSNMDLNENIIKLLKLSIIKDEEEIEEIYWTKRKYILRSLHGNHAIAYSIYCDWFINTKYAENTKKNKILKLITTTSIENNLKLFKTR